MPNIPLFGWLLTKLASLPVADGKMKDGFDSLSMAFLFTWAYLEITKGVNLFRRLLGLFVIVALIIGFYR